MIRCGGVDLGITPIQDVLAGRTSLAQVTALRATADGAVAASLATLAYSADGFDFGKKEPFHRRRMLTQLNRGESRHRLHASAL